MRSQRRHQIPHIEASVKFPCFDGCIAAFRELWPPGKPCMKPPSPHCSSNACATPRAATITASSVAQWSDHHVNRNGDVSESRWALWGALRSGRRRSSRSRQSSLHLPVGRLAPASRSTRPHNGGSEGQCHERRRSGARLLPMLPPPQPAAGRLLLSRWRGGGRSQCARVRQATCDMTLSL
jgi:hypothetical protein